MRDEHGRKVARPESEHIHLPDVTPAIVDAYTWVAVQERLRSKPKGDEVRNQKRFFLLRGMVKCRCGKPMQTRMNGKRRTYACSSVDPQHGGFCGNAAITADDVHFRQKGPDGRWVSGTQGAPGRQGLDNWVWRQILDFIGDSRVVDRLLEQERGAHDAGTSSLESELETTRAALAKANKKAEKLVALYASADDSIPLDVIQVQLATAQDERSALERAITELEARIGMQREAIEHTSGLHAYLDKVRARAGVGLDITVASEGRKDLYVTMDDHARRSILRDLGVSVVGEGRNWDLYVNLPVPDTHLVLVRHEWSEFGRPTSFEGEPPRHTSN